MNAFHAISSMVSGHIPGQLVVQFTSACNALCPQCGIRRTNTAYKRRTLTKEEVFASIKRASELHIQSISFTGGEPFLFEDFLVEAITKAHECRIPYIRTGTNGLPFLGHEASNFTQKMEKLAKRLTMAGLRNLWISIDSSDPAVHERMRGLPGVIEGVKKALPIFHAAGLYPAANLGTNRATGGNIEKCPPLTNNNENIWLEYWKESFRRFYSFVIDIGFTMANACYPMGSDELALDPSYQAASNDSVISFSRQEKALIFRALFEVIPEFRKKIRIFSPRISLYLLAKKYNNEQAIDFPCRGGVDFFFVSADDGMTYPCGYRSKETLGPFTTLKKDISLKPFCTLCDWECFRDPGALLEPMLMALHNPLKILNSQILTVNYIRSGKKISAVLSSTHFLTDENLSYRLVNKNFTLILN